MDIYLIKGLNGLVPADDEAIDALRKIKLGEIVKIKLSRPRNIHLHRKFFALLDVAFDNQDKYTNREAFRAELIILSGFFTVHTHVDGTTKLDPKSISFARMKNDEFSQLYQSAIDAIIENFLPGTDEEQLREEVDRIIQFA